MFNRFFSAVCLVFLFVTLIYSAGEPPSSPTKAIPPTPPSDILHTLSSPSDIHKTYYTPQNEYIKRLYQIHASSPNHPFTLREIPKGLHSVNYDTHYVVSFYTMAPTTGFSFDARIHHFTHKGVDIHLILNTPRKCLNAQVLTPVFSYLVLPKPFRPIRVTEVTAYYDC